MSALSPLLTRAGYIVVFDGNKANCEAAGYHSITDSGECETAANTLYGEGSAFSEWGNQFLPPNCATRVDGLAISTKFNTRDFDLYEGGDCRWGDLWGCVCKTIDPPPPPGGPPLSPPRIDGCGSKTKLDPDSSTCMIDTGECVDEQARRLSTVDQEVLLMAKKKGWSSDDIEILHNLMASDSSYGETIRTDPSFLDLLMDVAQGMEKEGNLV
eukprot:CAMPEP_0174698518 /NCGR_PEP_ID=MMETSP1094-20130205/4100_1 /TAXON_ID=156173 /ORGANISM="Chrysochromulina brevifilum, Strain UTEX LB 985" /LENGTH=212 /DNA_ID=CAMNT_0015895711 /DNA_START=75 /DNA_END=713 /DNA_ORIENTATION=+